MQCFSIDGVVSIAEQVREFRYSSLGGAGPPSSAADSETDNVWLRSISYQRSCKLPLSTMITRYCLLQIIPVFHKLISTMLFLCSLCYLLRIIFYYCHPTTRRILRKLQ